MNIIVDQASKSQRQSTKKFMTWLRQRTCRLSYGTKKLDHVFPSIKKQELQNRLNGIGGYGFPSLTNAMFDAHFDSKATHYFWGGHRGDQPEILIMLDIDVKKAQGLGSTEGGWAFARHLQTKWPNLYLESSTGGIGVHGFGVLAKGDTGPRQVRYLLRRLEQWLVDEAARFGADIELVEIKGLPPIIYRHRGNVSYVQAGEWGKIPRDVSRAAEIMDTTRFTLRQLGDLVISQEPESDEPPSPEVVEYSDPETVWELVKGVPTPCTDHDSGTVNRPLVECLDHVLKGKPLEETPIQQALQEVLDGVEVPDAKIPSARPQRTSARTSSPSSDAKERAGYGSGKFINTAHIDVIKEAIEQAGGFADMMVGRRVISAMHVALLLVIIRYCTKTIYSDGSMPTARILGLWRCLYDAGSVDIAPNSEIFRAVRNRLEDMSLLEEQDWGYTPPIEVDGKRLAGRACKWRLCRKLCLAMDVLITEKLVTETPLASDHSLLSTQGGEMMHTLFSARGLLFPQGRPYNAISQRNELIDAYSSDDIDSYEYAVA